MILGLYTVSASIKSSQSPLAILLPCCIACGLPTYPSVSFSSFIILNRLSLSIMFLIISIILTFQSFTKIISRF